MNKKRNGKKVLNKKRETEDEREKIGLKMKERMQKELRWVEREE